LRPLGAGFHRASEAACGLPSLMRQTAWTVECDELLQVEIEVSIEGADDFGIVVQTVR
jgi:hypothetical protein